jgi:hypothetical protein
MTAPFEPVTASLSVAVNLSPTLFVFVQMRCVEDRFMTVPAATEPTEPPVFEPVPLDTVLPLAVVFDGRVVVVAGRDEVVVRDGVVVRAGEVRVGVVAAGAGVVAAGTSWSAGFAAVSLLARLRSRLSAALSCASWSSFLSVVQAPANSAHVSANGATI